MDNDAIELVTRARSGQREALGDLCVLFQNYLRILARNGLGRKLRERVDLSDVVQEAMVEVVRQFPQFTGQTEAASTSAVFPEDVFGVNRLVASTPVSSRMPRQTGRSAEPLPSLSMSRTFSVSRLATVLHRLNSEHG